MLLADDDDLAIIAEASRLYADDDVDVLSIVEDRDHDGAWVHALVYVHLDAEAICRHCLDDITFQDETDVWVDVNGLSSCAPLDDTHEPIRRGE